MDTSIPSARVIRVLSILALWRGYPKQLRTDNGPEFISTFREDILDAYLFHSIEEVQALAQDWLEEYNAIRPHESLGGLPPYQFALK